MSTHARRATRGGLRDGFALLAALWFVVLIGGLGAHVAIDARRDRLAVVNRVERARARAAADAGIEHLRSRLSARIAGFAARGEEARLAWIAADEALNDTCALGVLRYAVSTRDVGGALNLNRATAEELTALLMALQVDAGRADRVGQAIADWRDADDLRRARGAERRDYAGRDSRRLPRNAPFREVEELRDVLDVDEDLYARVEAHLTVTGTGAINPNVAGTPVLLTLPGFGGEAAAAVLQLRSGGVLITNPDQLMAAIPLAVRNRVLDRAVELRARLTFETRELEFESHGWFAHGNTRVRIRGSMVRAGTGIILTGRRFP